VSAAGSYALPKLYFSSVLHLVRSNSPYTVLILAILTLALKLQALGHPVMPVADAHHIVFSYVVQLLSHMLGRSAAAFTLLAIVLTFTQGIYLMSIASRHRLFIRHSYVPAFVYIVLTCLHPALGQFSAPLLANWLILGALDAMLHFTRREEPNRTIFNAGFLLGGVAVLYFPALAYFILLGLALLLLRPFRPGEWVVGTLGYVTPFYFTLGILYLFDSLAAIKSWPHIGDGLPQKGQISLYLITLVSGCIFLLASGVFVMMRTYYRIPVAVRRGWGAAGTLMIISIVVCALTPREENAVWVNVLPAMALLITPPLLAERGYGGGRGRSAGFATFTFYLLLVLVVFCQLALRR
jgi:hypothetical protein